jgi:heptosyltransferase-2
MAASTHNVAFVAPNWLGDAVMSLPLLGYLETVRDLRISVLATASTARVYWGLAPAGEVLVHGGAGRFRSVLSPRRSLRQANADAAVILPPSFSSAFASLLAGTRLRIGYRTDGRALLLSHSISNGGAREAHLSANYLRLGELLVKQLGVETSGGHSVPKIRVFDDERRALDRLLDDAGAPGSGYAVVAPGATYGGTKQWPAAKYGEVVRKMADDIPVILAGSDRERELCGVIAGGMRGVFNLAGRTSLGELFALLERARVLVANDSGTPHAAASLGVPVVVIFGSTSPVWTAPSGSHVEVVRAPVHCSPCFLRVCPTELECYDGIPPARVLEAAGAALKKVENVAGEA